MSLSYPLLKASFLIYLLTEGVGKGATAIAANMIGAKEWSGLWKLLRSGIKFYIVLFLSFGIIFVFYPYPLINLFFDSDPPEREVYQMIVSSCAGMDFLLI